MEQRLRSKEKDASIRSRIARLLRHPLSLIVIGLVVLMTALAAANATVAVTGLKSVYVRAAATIFAAHAAYVLFVRFAEQRAVVELDPRKAGRGLIIGGAAGGLLFGVALAALVALDVYYVQSANGWSGVPAAAASVLTGAYIEELVFRGVLFRLLEKVGGTWLALLASALLFGAAHGGNDGATLLSTTAIALEAGILLCAVYVYARHLWSVIGLHFGWNLAQGTLFGVAVSGTATRGVFLASPQGPAWLTGGSFGIEASPVAVLICGSAAVLLLFAANRKHRIVRAPWRSRRASKVSSSATTEATVSS